MTDASFVYKCRRCAAIELNPHFGGPDVHMRAVVMVIDAIDGRSSHPQAPRLFSVHTCKDGGVGISDLQGCNITKDQPHD